MLASERAADARLLSQATPSGTTTLEDLDDDYREVRREARSLEAGAWVGTLLGAGLVGAELALLFIDEEQCTVLVPHLVAKPNGLTLGATLSF